MKLFKRVVQWWDGWGNERVVTFHGKSGLLVCVVVIALIGAISNALWTRLLTRDYLVRSATARAQLTVAVDRMYADELLAKFQTHEHTPFDEVLATKGEEMAFGLPDDLNAGASCWLHVIYRGVYLSVLIEADNNGEVKEPGGRTGRWRVVAVTPSAEKEVRH